MGMESFNKQKLEELHNIGKDFAFDGLSPEMFKANSEEEMRAFLEGYKEGLQLMKANNEEKESGMKMAA
jgi:hypothetical protein